MGCPRRGSSCRFVDRVEYIVPGMGITSMSLWLSNPAGDSIGSSASSGVDCRWLGRAPGVVFLEGLTLRLFAVLA